MPSPHSHWLCKSHFMFKVSKRDLKFLLQICFSIISTQLFKPKPLGSLSLTPPFSSYPIFLPAPVSRIYPFKLTKSANVDFCFYFCTPLVYSPHGFQRNLSNSDHLTPLFLISTTFGRNPNSSSLVPSCTKTVPKARHPGHQYTAEILHSCTDSNVTSFDYKVKVVQHPFLPYVW